MANRAELRPRVRFLGQLLEARMAADGHPVILVSGFRSFAQQAATWGRGRSTPGEPCHHPGGARPVGTCSDHPLGATVTGARPGWSWHNWGRALDYAFRGEGSSPSWAEAHPWGDLGIRGEALGLEWGGRWQRRPDRPHFQLPSPLSRPLLLRCVRGVGLRLGDRGLLVRELQLALGLILSHPPAPDGDFGPVTQSRVEEAQAIARLTVDGIVGPRTVAAIEVAIELDHPTARPWPRGADP